MRYLTENLIEATATVDVLRDLCSCAIISAKQFFAACPPGLIEKGMIINAAMDNVAINDIPITECNWRDSPTLRKLYSEMRINGIDIRDQIPITRDSLSMYPNSQGWLVVKRAQELVPNR